MSRDLPVAGEALMEVEAIDDEIAAMDHRRRQLEVKRRQLVKIAASLIAGTAPRGPATIIRFPKADAA